MQALTAGITKAGTGTDGIVWNILGQTYVPKSVNEASFSWHATFPPGTFVPPHIHPTQDEFIYMFEGRFDLMLDCKDFVATAGDLIRLPMGFAHGIFNKSDQPVKCFFWVAPTRKLYDLFWAIHAMKEQKPPTSSGGRQVRGRGDSDGSRDDSRAGSTRDGGGVCCGRACRDGRRSSRALMTRAERSPVCSSRSSPRASC